MPCCCSGAPGEQREQGTGGIIMAPLLWACMYELHIAFYVIRARDSIRNTWNGRPALGTPRGSRWGRDGVFISPNETTRRIYGGWLRHKEICPTQKETEERVLQDTTADLQG